jgi:hypothetical protein
VALLQQPISRDEILDVEEHATQLEAVRHESRI